MGIAGIIAILSSLIGIPVIVFGFIYLNKADHGWYCAFDMREIQHQ